MSIDSSWGSSHLQRSEIFRNMFKDLQLEPTMAQQWVNFIGDIPADSMRTELLINSIGELEVDNWFEHKSLPERRMDTGQFKFKIDEFKGLKVAFSDHFFETSFQANQVLAATPAKMKRAMDVYMETKILELANDQTLDSANEINGYKHRIIGGGDGTSAPQDSLTLQDFSYAKTSLRKAAAPMTNLIAIVDPLTEHNLNVKSNIVDISNNPRWEGLVETGMMDGTGLRFSRNIYGFDVYVSDFLADIDADEATLTDYKGVAPTAADISGFKSNIFMSFGGDASPFIGAMGRAPRFTSWRDEDVETEYHQLTQSFGLALYRPENLVTVLTSPTAIA